MKRIIVSAITILILLAAIFVTLPIVVSSQSIRAQLDKRIDELTAGRMTYQGEPHLSFTPFLRVELAQVVIPGEKQAEEQPDLLRIEKLQFSLKLLPLVLGKTRFSDLKLIRPKFNLLMHEDGSANWASFGSEIDALQGSANGDAVKQDNVANYDLGQLEIFDGIIASNIAGKESAIRITNLDANVDWPNVTSAWDISGNGVWRGEAFSFINRIQYPLVLFKSGKTELYMEIDSPTLTASFDGQATMLSDIQLNGEASIATPSLPRLYELLLNDEAIKRPPFGKFLVSGQVSANAREIRFDKSDIELDENIATGNLLVHWNNGVKPKVSGTLAFDTMDVTPLIEILSNKSQPITASGDATQDRYLVDFDVRFSAQNYKFKQNSFGALAATAMLNADEWTFDIGEADFFDGMIIATISSKMVDEEREIELKGILRDVSLGDIVREWYGGKIVTTGNANVDFNLKAPGDARIDNFGVFSGNMKVSLTDGQIDGIDLVKAIPALIENNGFVTVEEIKGVTPFNNLSLELLINNGVGWITKGNAQGGENEFRLSGKTDLVRGGLAIYTDISQVKDGENPPDKARIFIGGTVKNPLVTRSPLDMITLEEMVQ